MVFLNVPRVFSNVLKTFKVILDGSKCVCGGPKAVLVSKRLHYCFEGFQGCFQMPCKAPNNPMVFLRAARAFLTTLANMPQSLLASMVFSL